MFSFDYLQIVQLSTHNYVFLLRNFNCCISMGIFAQPHEPKLKLIYDRIDGMHSISNRNYMLLCCSGFILLYTKLYNTADNVFEYFVIFEFSPPQAKLTLTSRYWTKYLRYLRAQNACTLKISANDCTFLCNCQHFGVTFLN